MTQEEFDRALSRKKAKEEAVASSFATASDREIEPLLRAFISCKYFLRPEEMVTDDLIVLGELSTKKMAGIQKSGVKFEEKSAGCTSASSGVIKKSLLALAVGRLIGAPLHPDAVAGAKTVPQLAQLIVRARGRG